MDQDGTWHGGRLQPRRPCGVRWGPSPSPKGGRAPSPIFGPFLLWPNGWMHQDATSYGARPQPRGLCVRWGHSPLPKKGAEPPKFSAHVYCGQTAGWIKMALDMEVGLSPGDCVRWGPSTSPQIGGGVPSPIFGPSLLWPNGCMDQDSTWHRDRPQPRRLCDRWGPSPPPQKGGGAPSQFLANFYCAQTSGCITMPLGMEVGLSPGDFVFDGDPAASPKRGRSPLPNFRPMSIVAKWLDGSRWHLAWR